MGTLRVHMGHCCFPAEPSRLLTQQRQKATHAGDSLAITSQVVSCGTPTGPDLIREGLDSSQEVSVVPAA